MPERDRPAAVLVRGGLVVDADGERRGDVLITDGRIRDVGVNLEGPRGATVLDAAGCALMPGLVDLHTHLREPGQEDAETVESGSRAAALGGYTAVVAMPNTEPATDSAAAVRTILALARDALCEVVTAGAITVGRAGERLAPIAEMAALGVRLFTDDGRGVQNPALMRRALEYARPLGVILAEHCEDESLAAGGLMHEGAWSARLGLPGQVALAEEVMVARDIALVRATGSPMHFLHLSSAGSVAIVAAARAEGLPVTAEVTPHHLSLTDACASTYDPVFKVNPPLRTDDDVLAVRSGLLDGVIDAIATDHAPHPTERKEEAFDAAPPGMIGLETALAVAYDVLCRPAGVETACAWSVSPALNTRTASLTELVAWMSLGPARIAGLDASGHGGPIAPGTTANLCVFDLTAQWTVERRSGASRSENTPFAGDELIGQVRHTLYRGEPTVIDGKAQR